MERILFQALHSAANESTQEATSSRATFRNAAAVLCTLLTPISRQLAPQYQITEALEMRQVFIFVAQSSVQAQTGGFHGQQ